MQAIPGLTRLMRRMPSFEEGIKGSIEPGKLADFVVLNGDVLTTPADVICTLQVDLTMVDGNFSFTRESDNGGLMNDPQELKKRALPGHRRPP